MLRAPLIMLHSTLDDNKQFLGPPTFNKNLLTAGAGDDNISSRDLHALRVFYSSVYDLSHVSSILLFLNSCAVSAHTCGLSASVCSWFRLVLKPLIRVFVCVLIVSEKQLKEIRC